MNIPTNINEQELEKERKKFLEGNNIKIPKTQENVTQTIAYLLYIPKETHQQIKIMAAIKHTTMKDYILNIIEEKIKKDSNK